MPGAQQPRHAKAECLRKQPCKLRGSYGFAIQSGKRKENKSASVEVEAQPYRLAAPTEVAASVPSDKPLRLVTVNLNAFLPAQPGERGTVGLQDFTGCCPPRRWRS